jgi:protein involved in polysaccharide export with SLBB domain
MVKTFNRVASTLFFFTLVTGPVAASEIQAGDQLSVHVYNHPDLSSDNVKVNSHGDITVPVVGTLHVLNLQPTEVGYRLTRLYAPYVPYPAVEVLDTTESTSLFVAGGPGGVLAFAPGETLATAVADVEKELQRNQTTTSSSTNLTDQLDHSRIDVRRVGIIRNGTLFGTFDMQALRREGNPGPSLYANDTISFADKPIAVDVLGDVGIPGKAYLWADEPLSDAIEQAGGVRDSAALGRITLQPAGQTQRLVALGDAAFTEPASDGERLVIPTAPRVTVAGMVYQPGITTLKNNFTLLSAMYSAGGISKWADLRNVQVTHDGEVTHYDVTALTHGDVSQNPMLADGDTVFVPEGHKVDYSLIFSGLFSAGNILVNKL